MSLDNFQARYTSEDNASFTQILEDENRKRRERYGWAWDAQRRVEEQRVKMIEGREKVKGLIEAGSMPGVRERLVIEPPEEPKGFLKAAGEKEEVEEEEKEEGEDGGKGREVMLVDEKEGEKVDVMARKKDTRPAGVDGWKFKVSASLPLIFKPFSIAI